MTTLATRSRQVAVALMFSLSLLATSAVVAQESSTPQFESANAVDSPGAAAPQQALAAPALSVGIRASAAQTEFVGSSVGDSQSNMNVGAVGFLKVRLTDRFALQPEVAYTRTSGKIDHSRVIDGAKGARYELTHLKMPVLGKAYLNDDQRVFHLTAGPFARVRLSQDARSFYHLGLSGDVLDETLRKWDYGVDLGIGMEGLGSRGSVYVDLRYELGLANMLADSDQPDLRTRGLVFSVGVGT